MKVFSSDNLSTVMGLAGFSRPEFVRAMIRALPEGSTIKPSRTALGNVLDKGVVPGGDYLALYTHVLKCPVEYLFAEVES